MTIKNIINIENNRNTNEYYLIHLFKEGNWWSGYELSAFLCHIYKNNLKDKLKINKKHLKSENIDFIKIGLQEKSFDKYLPNNHNNINIIDNEHIIIDAKEFINIDINENNKDILLNDLKSKLQIKEKANNTNNPPINDNNHYNQTVNLLTIFNNILSYNTNNKTNDDLIIFINNLKNDINYTFLKMFN